MSFHNPGLSVHGVSDSFPVLLPVWQLFRKTESGVLLPYPVHHLFVFQQEGLASPSSEVPGLLFSA